MASITKEESVIELLINHLSLVVFVKIMLMLLVKQFVEEMNTQQTLVNNVILKINSQEEKKS